MKVIPIRRPLVTRLAGLPDGRLVAGFDDGSLQIFNVNSGHGERVAWDETPPKGGVNDIAVLPGGRIAIGFSGGMLCIYDTANCECVGMRDCENSINALVIRLDNILACGFESGHIDLHDASTGKRFHRFKAHEDSVLSLAALPDGCLASGSYDGEVKIWDPIESTCRGTIECGDALAYVPTNKAVHCMSALPNGLLAFSVAGCSKVLLCSIEGLQHVGIYYQDGWVRALEVLSDGQLAVATDFRTISLWNAKAGASKKVLYGHQDQVKAMTVLADGRLASADDDTIRVWDL